MMPLFLSLVIASQLCLIYLMMFGFLFLPASSSGVTIDMTVPVINRVIPGEGPLCDNNFTYSFYVPSKYQDSGPPAPTNPDVYTNILPEFSAYVRLVPSPHVPIAFLPIG